MGWALLFIALGLLLLVAEVFIPTGGILFVVSLFLIGLGVVKVFFVPESEGGGTGVGLLVLSCVFVLVPTAVAAGFYYWQRTPYGKRFFLTHNEEDDTVASMPEYLELEQLKGQIGRTVTELRPSGVTLIQGHRIDTKTEGLFVEAGRWVRVVDVRPGQVTVRPLDADEIRDLPDLVE